MGNFGETFGVAGNENYEIFRLSVKKLFPKLPIPIPTFSRTQDISSTVLKFYSAKVVCGPSIRTVEEMSFFVVRLSDDRFSDFTLASRPFSFPFFLLCHNYTVSLYYIVLTP